MARFLGPDVSTLYAFRLVLGSTAEDGMLWQDP